MASSFEMGRAHNLRFVAGGGGAPPATPLVTDETVRLFLAWMEGVFVGTPDAMRDAVKQAMTKALAGEECPYA